MNTETVEIIRELVREKFDSIDFKFEYIHKKGETLIKMVRNLELNDFAIELENDLKTETTC